MEYSGEHLSPPSTLSRQSDSDASDVDDCCSGRRVGADGASISSLGSSIRYVVRLVIIRGILSNKKIYI